MTDIRIQPQSLEGAVTIPPSKSMAHRAIIAAGLALGQSRIENIQLSDDILATIAGMEALGAKIRHQPDLKRPNRMVVEVDGLDLSGPSPSPPPDSPRQIDANESGTTLRILIPLASLIAGPTQFIGRGKLGSRPLDLYETIYHDQGLRFDQKDQALLDLTVDGRLQAGHYALAGNVSSQFISGLLFTLPLLEGDSVIQITTPIESISYIDLTLEVLDQFGVRCEFDPHQRRIDIPGQQAFHPQNYVVEADYSQAAFFLGAAALGQDVLIQELDPQSKQGDRQIIPVLNEMGASLEWTDEGVKAMQPQLSSDLVIDGSQIPDVIPLLAAVSCLADGQTRIENLHRLKIKESDRLMATQQELSRLGAHIHIDKEALVIEGQAQLAGGQKVWSHKDHRMAMMLAIVSSRCQDDIIIEDAECVSKSFPDFWQVFENLGGIINEWRMG